MKNLRVIGILTFLGLMVVALAVMGGRQDVHIVNDGTTEATVTVASKTFRLAPGEWRSLTIGNGDVVPVTAAFTDGTKAGGTIDLVRKEGYAQFRLFALAGRGCFAVADISRVYGHTNATFSIVKVYRHVQNVEHSGGQKYFPENQALPEHLYSRAGSRGPVYGVYSYPCDGSEPAPDIRQLLGRHPTARVPAG
jgi:hypothetical protein